MMNKMRLELGKANEFRHVAHEFRLRPGLEECVLRLGRSIAICTYIDANELKTLWKDEAFAKVQR
jgi:hypothetical protein